MIAETAPRSPDHRDEADWAVVMVMIDWRIGCALRPPRADCSDLTEVALERIKGLAEGTVDPHEVMKEINGG